MIWGRIWSNVSISFLTVDLPRVNRRDDLLHPDLFDNAPITYEAEFSDKLLQALVDEQAIPASSSFITANSASRLEKQMFMLFGRRFFASPFKVAFGNFFRISTIK